MQLSITKISELANKYKNEPTEVDRPIHLLISMYSTVWDSKLKKASKALDLLGAPTQTVGLPAQTVSKNTLTFISYPSTRYAPIEKYLLISDFH